MFSFELAYIRFTTTKHEINTSIGIAWNLNDALKLMTVVLVRCVEFKMQCSR